MVPEWEELQIVVMLVLGSLAVLLIATSLLIIERGNTLLLKIMMTLLATMVLLPMTFFSGCLLPTPPLMGEALGAVGASGQPRLYLYFASSTLSPNPGTIFIYERRGWSPWTHRIGRVEGSYVGYWQQDSVIKLRFSNNNSTKVSSSVFRYDSDTGEFSELQVPILSCPAEAQ